MSSTKLQSVDLSKLPSFQNYNSEQISQSFKNLTGSQSTIYNILRLAVIGAIGYGVWVYVLPIVFVAVGYALGIAAGVGILAFLFFARHGIFKWMKNWARAIDKAAINNNPFLEFERQKKKLIDAKEKFYQSFGRMQNLAQETKKKSFESEERAKEYQEKFSSLNAKATKLREQLATVANKNTDEYTNLNNSAAKAAAEANGLMLKYKQANGLTEKYGARAAVMDNLVRKLSTGTTYIDIKIMEFDNTVDMLKVDYDYYKESAEATSQMRNSLMFEEEWQLTYAIEATKAITADYISTTQMNLKDIESLTSNYSIDNEAIFAKLDAITQKIETGEEKAIDASTFNNPDYQLTAKDRANVGFGSNMFN